MNKSAIQHIYKIFTEERIRAEQLHQHSGQGMRVALMLTRRHDRLLQTLFKMLPHDTSNFTVVALGGYGRKELCFESDTDIMLLVPSEEDRAPAEPIAQQYLHSLLDAGLDVGHSFRTVDECTQFIDTDLESWMSLLEARYLCGNKTMYQQFQKKIQETIFTSDHRKFARQISEIRRDRLNKYGDSSKLLEPNIKQSAGGLRDLHAMYWLLRGTGILQIPKMPLNSTATLMMLQSNTLHRQFNTAAIDAAFDAFNFILRVRNEMHLQARNVHDTLEFSFQQKIAAGLHYRSYKKQSEVERFMQQYYSAMRAIETLCQQTIDWSMEQWSLGMSEKFDQRLDERFMFKSNRLYTYAQRLPNTNSFLLEAFSHQARLHRKLSFDLQDVIHRRAHNLHPLSSERDTFMFRYFMNLPDGVADAMRSMSNLGVLERWIPEWKPMLSFFQHNQYHYYTADEHTLLAIAHAEALATADGIFGDLYRTLPRKDVLLLACLLHDMAKPLHLRKHEIVGAKLAKKILTRLHFGEIADDVAFLVRYHLAMEQIAFRRNLNDPQTIVEFAKIFKNVQQLQYLYLLTYADLSAVNKNAWTAWKNDLLYDLYRKAVTVIAGRKTVEEVHWELKERQMRLHTEIIKHLSAQFQERDIRLHLQLLTETPYAASFSPEEIGKHLLAISKGSSATALFSHTRNITEATFISKDAPGILSNFCGVLSANDANILDAEVFTRTDGIVIDRFRVVDFHSKKLLQDEVCEKISADLLEVIEGRIDITKLLDKHRMKWKRRARKANPNVRCDVQFDEHPRFTIIDVYAPDTLGFLHLITGTIAKLGLNIHVAKISTRADGIVDSFYVLNSDGIKLTDETRRAAIREEILSTIKNLLEEELVITTV
ncbi:MAG TPA: [protein-PII] uridylyltransferase [Bacteroidota bacterium]|nr:[protein-PII] uridylyltransferase [Bacteroidota bacterium]